ncbi:MAG TPA: hypothetical protein IAC38_04475 [Candidatus Caccovivens faecavium]|nr:hypothetical protein [Candidatus Caccovivens faecavium]
MDLTNLLKYQELDEKLYNVEQRLTKSPARKRAGELSKIAKNAQVKSNELELEAGKVLKEIEDVKAKFEENKKSLQSLLNKDLDKLSMEDLDKITSLKAKILSNLNFLEKHLQKHAELVNRILTDFNKTKKMYDEARVQFIECKNKIDEETKALEPEKERLVKELEELSKSVEKNLLAEYKKRRNDNIFPVVVPLEGTNFCGRCRMELPMVAISRIKDVGVITCEHCKRLVYKK